MAHKTNKLISIVLMLTMLIGITGTFQVTSYASGGSITLTCPERSDLLEGSKVRLGFTTDGVDGIASYKLFKSTDGVSYVEEGECSSDASYALAEIEATQRYYIVKAYDAAGGELAASNAVTLSGKRPKTLSTIWDLDFDNPSISVIASGDNRYLSADGTNNLLANGDSFGMHVGDADNTITVGSSSAISGASNGNSLIFTTNGNAGNCQTNNGWAKVSSGIAVWSYDVATTTYATKTLITGAAAKAAGGNQWMPTVETRDDGSILMYLRSQNAAYAASGTTKITTGTNAGYTNVGTYETNKWYNIKFVMNISEGLLDIYIDDVYIATDMDRVSTTMTPARFQLSNGTTNGSLYVDNIKAYTIEHLTVNPGLSLACDAKDYSLPEGTKVKLDITATDIDDMARIDLLKSTDGTAWTVADTFTNTKASTYVTLSKQSTAYIAKAYDGAGSVLKESEQVELCGSPVVLEDTPLWDIDFEDEQFSASAEYRYLSDETGTALTMSHSAASSTLTAHTGSTLNDMTIEDSGDTAHGNAVKFSVADEKQVQFNEFRARTTGGTVIGQWDIKFSELPPKTANLTAILLEVDAAPNLGGSNEIPTGNLLMQYNGNVPYFAYHDGSSYIYLEELKEDVWYTLKSYTDLDNGVVSLFIDDRFAVQNSFDTSNNCMEKYVARLGYAAGAEMWVDNFKVQRASMIPVPKIVSVTNDEYGMYIEFAHAMDASLFYTADSAICNISVETDGNVLDIVSCAATDNAKILKFTSNKKVFTSVPLDIVIDVPYSDTDSMTCTYTYTPAAAELDVTDVSATYNGTDYDIEATLCNTSGSPKTAVMIAVFYDSNDNIVAVKPSAQLDNVTNGSKITLSGSVTAEKMHIFFIDAWTSSRAIKNVIYKR